MPMESHFLDMNLIEHIWEFSKKKNEDKSKYHKISNIIDE
jgi:hypothetical protein